jgi:hypothetical protein
VRSVNVAAEALREYSKQWAQHTLAKRPEIAAPQEKPFFCMHS